MPSFNPQPFEFETTNQAAFKDFRFSKPEHTTYQTPSYHPTETKAPKCHFKSLARNDLVKHQYRQPAIDFIPYP